MTKRKSNIGLLAALVVFIAGATYMENLFTPMAVKCGYMIPSESDQPSSEAVSHAFGEFRIVAANMIWLNVVDRYHHEYMEQGGDWAKNAALLPYLRMITWLDPHFIEAYDIAGTILSELKRYPEAKAFVTEGIKHNGTNWQMYYDMAMIDAWYCKDPKSALPFAIKAYDYVEDPFYKRRMGWLVATLKSDISPSTGASSSHPLAVSRQLKN